MDYVLSEGINHIKVPTSNHRCFYIKSINRYLRGDISISNSCHDRDRKNQSFRNSPFIFPTMNLHMDQVDIDVELAI